MNRDYMQVDYYTDYKQVAFGEPGVGRVDKPVAFVQPISASYISYNILHMLDIRSGHLRFQGYNPTFLTRIEKMTLRSFRDLHSTMLQQIYTDSVERCEQRFQLSQEGCQCELEVFWDPVQDRVVADWEGNLYCCDEDVTFEEILEELGYIVSRMKFIYLEGCEEGVLSKNVSEAVLFQIIYREE